VAFEYRLIPGVHPFAATRGRLARQMTCRATVTIPASYGRALREITGTPWYRRCDWITVTADDVVSPADSGPRI
jgi:hypothetical protein